MKSMIKIRDYFKTVFLIKENNKTGFLLNAKNKLIDKKIIIIFILFYLLPFLGFEIFKKLYYYPNDSELKKTIDSIIFNQILNWDIFFKIGCPIFGFCLSFFLKRKEFIKKGWFCVYLFPFLKAFRLIFQNNKFNQFFESLFLIFVVTFSIIFCPFLRERLFFIHKKEEKKIKKTYFYFFHILISLFLVFISIFTILFFNKISEYYKQNKSYDSNYLISSTSFQNYNYLFHALFIGPIFEEIVFRFGFFNSLNGIIIPSLFSSVTFIFIHIENQLSFKNIFDYKLVSFIILLIFISTKGNIFLTSIFHIFFNNFSSFMLYTLINKSFSF